MRYTAKLLLLATALCLAVPVHAQMKDYAEVVTDEAESRSGLFTVHRIDDRLLFVHSVARLRPYD